MNTSLKKFLLAPFRLLHRWRIRIAIFFAIACLLLVIILAWPMDPSPFLTPHPSGEMRDRSGRLLYAFLNDRQQWCFQRPLPQMSPHLVEATLATEDRRFYAHPGIDPLAVVRAAWQNLSQRRIISGASTLTMQVVKQQGRSSSLSGKLRQAFTALRLDLRAGKNDILTAYLNAAPYGLNLAGCEAASRRYLGKPCIELSLSEAALLAGLPQSPTRYQPIAHPQQALKRRNFVLHRMLEEKFITRQEYAEASRESVAATWHEFPQNSPHLAMRLKPIIESNHALTTTLDEPIQQTAQSIIARRIRNLGAEVTNAAVIVIDVPSAQVLAHIGSAGFNTTPGGGQVDATRAVRSPGSTLKPFVYALAMERHRLYDTEMLLDNTLDYGLFSAENFDKQFHGLTSATDALRRSLNIPAITVLERIGIEPFYDFMKGLELTTFNRPPEYYGLGLTVGTCGVKLEQLAGAYTMLANLGVYQRLQFIPETPTQPASGRKLSRGSCLKLYQMLEQALPNELDDRTGQTINIRTRACWKTGTSTGRHDAWAFVFNTRYVVGVWLGNNDGKPSPRLVGGRAALPAAAEIFRALPVDNQPNWPDFGDDMREITVCAATGLPASRWCPHAHTARFPRTQYINRLCDVHYPAVSTDNSLTTGGIIERWPGSAHGWDLANVINVAEPAPGGPSTGAMGRLDALAILTPPDKTEIILSGTRNGDRLKLETSLDELSSIHWYLDGQFLGTAYPFKPLLIDITEGSHQLACMTPGGLTAKTQFEVLANTEQ